MAVLRNRYPPNIPPAGADPLLKKYIRPAVCPECDPRVPLSLYSSGNNPNPYGLLHKYRVSEHIHYFTNTLEVLQQCNIFKTWPKFGSFLKILYFLIFLWYLYCISKVVNISRSTAGK